MTTDARVLSRPRDAAVGFILLTLLALSVAIVFGYPGIGGIPSLVIAGASIAGALALARFYAGYLLMVASSFTLIVVTVFPGRFMNAFDLLLPFMLPIAFWGSLRRQARAEERTLETGEAHERIREAARLLCRSVILFYSLAMISQLQVLLRLGGSVAVTTSFFLARSVEGLFMYPLGLWWLRSDRRIYQLMGAAFAGGLLLGWVMLADRITVGTVRPGMTWILNEPGEQTLDPNQAALNMVLLIAFLMAYGGIGSWLWALPLTASAITALVLSQSRSGLLAMIAFLGLNLKRIPRRYLVAGAILLALGLLAVPKDFASRIARTVAMERGSPELFSWMVRVYGYFANVKLFLDNWLIGTGFLSGQFLTQHYNDLGLPLGAENYYLETAVGMGVIGLGVLCLCFVRLFQLGRVVLEVAPPGSLGHRLARLHVSVIVGLMVAALTQNSLLGLIASAQLGIWCAALIRAGHNGLRSAGQT